MSDWLATHSGVASIKAGLDMNMPGDIDFPNPTPSFWGEYFTLSVKNGSLLEERVNDMVLQIMTPYFYLGQDADFPPIDGYTPRLRFFGASGYPHNFTLGPTVDARYRKHANLIWDLGAAGTVLLKNTNGALPLRTP
jgi:beta-glucosidase